MIKLDSPLFCMTERERERESRQSLSYLWASLLSVKIYRRNFNRFSMEALSSSVKPLMQKTEYKYTMIYRQHTVYQILSDGYAVHMKHT